MDLIVQKAVEIGAAEIAPSCPIGPWCSSIRRTPRRSKRNEKVALEAAKQCGQNWLPNVHKPRSPNEFFRDLESGLPTPARAGVSPTGTKGGASIPPAPQRPTPASLHFDLRLIGSLQPGARHLKKILADYAGANGEARPASVLMMIGPEGDFTPAEIALARSQGCAPSLSGPLSCGWKRRPSIA